MSRASWAIIPAAALVTLLVGALLFPSFNANREEAILQDKMRWGQPYDCSIDWRQDSVSPHSTNRLVLLDCGNNPPPEGEIFERALWMKDSRRESVPVWRSTDGEFFVQGDIDRGQRSDPYSPESADGWIFLLAGICLGVLGVALGLGFGVRGLLRRRGDRLR